MIDFNTLTAADVDLIEDTLNEQLAKHPAFATRIITFADVIAGLKAMRAATNDEDGDPAPAPPGSVTIPLFKVMRAFELVELRRTNPAATWADTGQQRLVSDDEIAAAVDAPEHPWSPPSSEPSA